MEKSSKEQVKSTVEMHRSNLAKAAAAHKINPSDKTLLEMSNHKRNLTVAESALKDVERLEAAKRS